jgi:MFS family permease
MSAAFFPALAVRNVRIYLTGQTLSVLGLWTQTVTLSLLVYHLTASAALLGLTNFLLHGPMLFVAPYAGRHIHPGNARRIASIAMALAGLAAAAIGLLALTGRASLAPLLCFAAVAGVLNAVEMPARQVMLSGSVTEPELLSNAVAMNSLVFNVGRMTGPAIAAFLYVKVGAAAGFFAYAVTLIVMTRCLALLDLPRDVAASGEKVAFMEGLRHVVANSFNSLFLAVVILLGILAASYQTLIPVLADQVFGNTATMTGVLFAFAGAGALLAAIALSSRYGKTITRRLLALAPWLSALSMATVSFAASIAVAGAALCMLGFTLTFITATTNSSLQRNSPPRLRGAMAGLYAMAFLGTVPIGHLLMGAVASRYGVRTAFLCASLLLAGCLVPLYLRKWKTDGAIVGAMI